MRVVAMLVALSAVVLSACGPDLGTCNEERAMRVVYVGGTPYYEGQALIQAGCAGSQCHAQVATGAARSGAPHGLNFDLEPLKKDATMQSLNVLREGLSTVRKDATDIWAAIDDGSMPPGKVGARQDLPSFLDADATMDAQLGGLDLAEARDKVRNWLACNAPIIAATDDSPLMTTVTPTLGASKPIGKVTIGPTFSSIYDNLLAQCTGCHGASGVPGQALNLSTKDVAHGQLVSKASFAGSGAVCGGRQLVVPNDCMGSLLYQKLSTPTCGGLMPQGATSPQPQNVLDAICGWINAGAPLN